MRIFDANDLMNHLSNSHAVFIVIIEYIVEKVVSLFQPL